MGKLLVGIILLATLTGQPVAAQSTAGPPAGDASGSAADPAYPALERAYAALQQKDYETAIAQFRRGIELAPGRAGIRKDLGYTLLKVGESEAARDQFAEAMRLDPGDEHVALEYAFLCYETKQPIEARRVFDRLRQLGNATAAEAFENIDRPLREGIARWLAVIARSPANFSAHEELARLAENRDDLPLAARHYEQAWRLRRNRRDLLLDLGRVWQQVDRVEDANAALLAASRGSEPRTAEKARALLPDRYPYVYEFENALRLDPSNEDLRRELAYLLQTMGNSEAAERQFELLPERAPTPPASSTPQLVDRPTPPPAAKVMADRSLEAGYLNDALRYLHAAHEDDPEDFEVMLKLGQTYNTLKADKEALRWFDMARESPDPATAQEASRAYHNLAPMFQRIRTTVWAYPMISTRWRNTFAYAQAKSELRLPGFPLRPYLSVRFIGDMRGSLDPVAGLAPQYLSERSVILGGGLATPAWRGLTAWFEAGQAVPYVDRPNARIQRDLRGGLSFAKGWGAVLSPGRRGLFAETNADVVFMSRFNNDTLLYSQTRTGWTFRSAEDYDGFHAQVYWNWNATVDARNEYWANTVETGPGAAFVFEAMPSVVFSVSALRGVYLNNAGNPFRPNYDDIRIGIWHAFSF